MRAKLSAVAVSGFRNASLAGFALDEARAILAETEWIEMSPLGRGFYVSLTDVRQSARLVLEHYGRSFAQPHEDCAAALAESLAAFVGQE